MPCHVSYCRSEQARHLLQGQAESYLEKLHKMVEQDLNDLLDGNRPTGDWPAFRETLIGLTDVTQVLSVAFAMANWGVSQEPRAEVAVCRLGMCLDVGRRFITHWPSVQSHFAKLVDELERGMASLLDTYRTGAFC